MLEAVKKALAITVNAYDDEIDDLIAAALADLGLAGVDSSLVESPLIIQAVKTYCRAHFKSPSDYDRLKAAYDEQKAQLATATGYTDWGDGSAEG
jgi:hypothetical protein